jgi:hypothetical protein
LQNLSRTAETKKLVFNLSDCGLLFWIICLSFFSMERRLKEIAIRKPMAWKTNTLLERVVKQYVSFVWISNWIFPAYFLRAQDLHFLVSIFHSFHLL